MILAVDQGTTSTRAILVHADGRAQQLLSRTHRQHRPGPGRVEHDPVELLANVAACLDAGRAAGAVACGLANQGESCLGWDADTGAPVSPVIVWQDDRTRSDLERLAHGADLVADRAGLPLDPYFSASKLAWILREIPAARALAARGRLRLGTTDAWFRDRLTGRFQTDPTTASRTSLMALATCDWDADLCALFGVPVDALPRIVSTTGDLGTAPGLPLTASATDQQAALFGHGARVPGHAKITFGTGAFALAVTDGVRHGGGLSPTIAWQRQGAAPVYAIEGGVHAASSAVDWARGLGLFADIGDIGAFDAAPAVARGLVFVPALAGLAAPHWDRSARGAWLGLDMGHGPRDMVQALLEGIAFRAAEVLAAMDAVQPLAGPVSIDGGMTANAYFCRFLADCTGREVQVSAQPELTAVGIAALAAEAAGIAVALPREGRLLSPRIVPETWTRRFTAARSAVQAFGAGSD